MHITGPSQYQLAFDAKSFAVTCAKGTNKFSGTATSKNPKLYVVSVDGWPVYVGITKQPMRNRLRFGWKATGRHGYHGYAWRHLHKKAVMDIWCHEDAPTKKPLLGLETVEAELVFLIRKAGQWPAHQTEIHFHPSEQWHRDAAKAIMRHYRLRRATERRRSAMSRTGAEPMK
jgi:hypothetical protein